MGGPEFGIAIIVILITAVLCSVPVVLALGLTSFFGLAYLTGSVHIAGSLLANTTYEAIRDYVFAVIPLFVLMGEFISRSGAAADLYKLVNRTFRRLPGRLALATVGGNAVFGAVTGVSIASAAAFSRIAYPEMVQHRYAKSVALGAIAGSASLGMLIPPSVLLIVWGVISEQSI
ncbi:MAG: TRAP transporter large permease subunit, partial [Pseudomonadota bacterium]